MIRENFMNKKVIYQLDGRPELKEAIPLGLQHILAMFLGNVAPLIIISNILNLDSSILYIQQHHQIPYLQHFPERQ